jgi:acyl carrier protein
MSIVDSSLRAGVAQVAAIRVDWTKWRTFFRGVQANPLLERIFAGVEGHETSGVASDWRNRIESAAPEEKENVIAQAVREVVGSVLRVKPDTLHIDQPLTDLGLDSLMGVEIENSLETAIGVALPPTSLMRARTIGQIATLIAGHLAGAASAVSSPAAMPTPALKPTAATLEVDLDALSNEQIDRLLGNDQNSALEVTSDV